MKKPNSEAEMLKKLEKKLTDKGMPIKMAKSVAAKQAAAKKAPKKPAMFKDKMKPEPAQSKKPKNVKGGPVLFKAKAKPKKKPC